MYFLLFCLSCFFREKQPPHVILIVLDTVRADSLQKSQTPNWDAFAQNGQELQKAWAPSTWTLASMVSIFSGLSVGEHGWDFPMPKNLPKDKGYPSLKVGQTLAEVMQQNGYQTIGLYANRILYRDLGFSRGFLSWKFSTDQLMHKEVQKSLKRGSAHRPFFFYVHLYGAHQPLRPSLRAQKKWGIEEDLQDYAGKLQLNIIKTPEGEALYRKAYGAVLEDVDLYLGEILQALDSLKGEKIIMITSDHGELLGEYGYTGHPPLLYEELTWVPMVVQGMRLPDPFSLQDIPVSICEAAQLSCPFQRSSRVVSQREGKVSLLLKTWEKWREGRCFALPDEKKERPCSSRMKEMLERLPISKQQSLLQKSWSIEEQESLRKLGYME